MNLSYSLDVRHVPLYIPFFNFMFSYLNCIIYDFFSLRYNPDLGTEFIPTSVQLWEKWRIFHTYNPAVFFVKRDEILSKLINFKYENIKFNKCEAEHA
jgi:hypothetical protein